MNGLVNYFLQVRSFYTMPINLKLGQYYEKLNHMMIDLLRRPNVSGSKIQGGIIINSNLLLSDVNPIL